MIDSSQIPALMFSHVGFYVHDLAVMEDFYSRVLGFTVTDRGTLAGPVNLVFLSRDPNEHHQIVLANGRPPSLTFNPINQLSFRLSDLPALRYFHQVLMNEQISEIAPVTHGNAISLYFRDPENNRLELFFDTPWYCQQPCREPIDLNQSDRAILAYTEQLARTLPGFKSRAAWMEELSSRIQNQSKSNRSDLSST